MLSTAVGKKAMWAEKRARTLAFCVLALLVTVLIGLVLEAKPAHAKTFTVNSTGDGLDAAPDGVCNTLLFAPGVVPQCTLRAAIQEANANNNQATVVDQIEFSIPATGPQTISVATSMHAISEPVVIDGYTQPGAKKNTLTRPGKSNAVLKIQLRGPGDSFAEALTVGSGASGSVIRGLAIGDFTTGILLYIGSGNNRVEGNFIGTDTSGTVVLGNQEGVHIFEAPNNTIGGTTATAGVRNVITGNLYGVRISSDNATGNKIAGNNVGIDASGTQSLASSRGVEVTDAPNNTIGGATAGAGNVITGNVNGVVILGDNATGNRILSNSIYDNGTLGIDLGGTGVTPNDGPDDGDIGPNNLQNKPQVTSAKPTKKQGRKFTTITGTLNSTPSRTFTVQLFANLSGEDEGRTLVAHLPSITTNSTGAATFTKRVSRSAAPLGSTITATATDNSTGDTSEISTACPVSGVPCSR